MPVPKRQHFIPRMHLQHFAGPEPKGHVWTYDAQTGQARHTIPEETGLESHFYSVESDDGTMDTRIEAMLSEAETRAAPVYGLLLKGETPGETQDRMNFAEFLALMYLRTPTMRRMNAEMIGRHMQIMCHAYGIDDRAFDAMLQRTGEATRRPPLTPEQKERLRRDFIDPSGYKFQISRERTLEVLGASEQLAPLLFQMTWSIIAPRRGFFVTSDNPLIRDVDPATRHPIYGDHGFLNKTAQVLMPLSPDRLLFMSWNKDFSGKAVCEPNQVDGVNRALAEKSDRYLYAHAYSKELLELSAEFKDSRPQMTTEGFGLSIGVEY